MRGSSEKRLNVIWLPVSHCNARCTYCFSNAGGASMEVGAVRLIAARLADYCATAGVSEMTFFWQGGEILLLGKEWVREAHRLLQCELEESGVETTHRLQSNLLLVDREWTDIFHELFDGRVSTSFDFPNHYRVLGDGDPAVYTELWLDKFALVREAGNRCGVICVPSAATVKAGAADVCRFFFDEAGGHGFQVNLPFPSRSWESGGGAAMERAANAELADFLCDLYDQWRKNYATAGKQLQPMARLETYFSGGSRRLPCVWGKDCAGEFICVGPGGEVGLCDCWVLSYPEYNYGNLLESPLDVILEAERRQQIRSRLGKLVEGPCGECAYLDTCFGGCPIRTFTHAGSVEQSDPYCEVYLRVFKHIDDSGKGVSVREVTG